MRGGRYGLKKVKSEGVRHALRRGGGAGKLDEKESSTGTESDLVAASASRLQGQVSAFAESSRVQQAELVQLERRYQQLLAANNASGLSVHVLDTSAGVPGAGMDVTLEAKQGDGTWTALGAAVTAATGRAAAGLLQPGAALEKRQYRLSFNTSGYFAARGQKCFYPAVIVTFRVDTPAQHHHIPLLVSPFGYTTYKGS